ncbi:MAG: hypothetical protein K2X81_16510, partial [Candidatus Obscuribacterales bacterium]|nr:hypothetical protein [Candidatus Obscuribacterales bacterium]
FSAAVLVHIAQLQVMRLQPQYISDYHNKRLISKPEVAKAFSLGFNRVLADVFWLQFVQYYGDINAAKFEKFRYAPDYIRLVVTMDPHFLRPYYFASFVLAGDMNEQAEAEKILNAGITENPNDWSLPYIAGFNQYLFAQNQEKAAKYYRIAAARPGSPSWLNGLVKIMESPMTRRLTGVIKSWEKIFKSDDHDAKEHARQQLQDLWSGVYYYAPTERIKNHALDKLNEFNVSLLKEDQLPPPGQPNSVLPKGADPAQCKANAFSTHEASEYSKGYSQLEEDENTSPSEGKSSK